MVAYSIKYSVRNKEGINEAQVDAKDIKSAKKKLGRKHGYADGRMIKIEDYSVVGYF